MPTIKFERHPTSLSRNTIGTDGLNALRTVLGVIDPEVVDESEERVTITYQWDASMSAPDLAAHFVAFGLRKVAESA